MAGAGMRETELDLTLDTIAVERGQHLQLGDLVRAAIERAVGVGELLARQHGDRRERNRPFECVERLTEVVLVPQAHPAQVVRVRELVVQLDRLVERRQRAIEIAKAIAGESELVGNLGRPVVEVQARLVLLGGGFEPLAPVLDVSEILERARGGGVDGGSLDEVVGGGVEVGPLQIGFPAPEVREHRVRSKGDGGGISLQGIERLAVTQGRIPAAELQPVVAFAGGRLVGKRASDGSQREEHDKGNGSFH